MTNLKLPAIQFYPGDWRKDPGIRALDFMSRAAWFEMLLLMHESEVYGKLVLNGKAMPEEALATAIGISVDQIKQILSKVLAYGVASIEEDTGIIYNRRMVRDKELRDKRAESGSLGGSKTQANRKQISTPSSSISTSLSEVNTAEDFLKEIKKNTAYSHIDIDRELSKMDAWLLVNPSRKKTKRFVVNWLNKIEKPLGAHPVAVKERKPNSDCTACGGSGDLPDKRKCWCWK